MRCPSGRIDDEGIAADLISGPFGCPSNFRQRPAKRSERVVGVVEEQLRHRSARWGALREDQIRQERPRLSPTRGRRGQSVAFDSWLAEKMQDNAHGSLRSSQRDLAVQLKLVVRRLMRRLTTTRVAVKHAVTRSENILEYSIDDIRGIHMSWTVTGKTGFFPPLRCEGES